MDSYEKVYSQGFLRSSRLRSFKQRSRPVSWLKRRTSTFAPGYGSSNLAKIWTTILLWFQRVWEKNKGLHWIFVNGRSFLSTIPRIKSLVISWFNPICLESCKYSSNLSTPATLEYRLLIDFSISFANQSTWYSWHNDAKGMMLVCSKSN